MTKDELKAKVEEAHKKVLKINFGLTSMRAGLKSREGNLEDLQLNHSHYLNIGDTDRGNQFAHCVEEDSKKVSQRRNDVGDVEGDLCKARGEYQAALRLWQEAT